MGTAEQSRRALTIGFEAVAVPARIGHGSGMTPFHLASPVRDLEATRRFYVDVLGAGVGREAARWIDFDLRGHQVSAHLVDETAPTPASNPVDGDQVPSFHFGLVLPWYEWVALGDRLQAEGRAFLIAPRIRFAGEVGEQGTLFLRDPSGHAVELKAFRDPARLFAR
jgi:extradiol dioxygenase family protein